MRRLYILWSWDMINQGDTDKIRELSHQLSFPALNPVSDKDGQELGWQDMTSGVTNHSLIGFKVTPQEDYTNCYHSNRHLSQREINKTIQLTVTLI